MEATNKGASAWLRARDLVVERGDFTLRVPELAVDPGRCVGLIGPNGAGKTTLLETLAGRLDPTAGAVTIRDVPLDAWGYERATMVGIVRDELEGLPRTTVRAHLALRCAVFPTWDVPYARELVDALAVPLDTRLDRLSKGTRTKVAFVSVEAYRPPVLLLDEPTSGLDPVARGEFLRMVKEAATGPDRALVFSTHLTEDVERVADRLLVLGDGALRADLDLPPGEGAEGRRARVAEGVEVLRGVLR